MSDGIFTKNRFRSAVVAYDDVIFVEQMHRKIIVHTSNDSYWEYCSMEAMLARMDGRMYRCHHSLAVNMNLIRSISTANVEMRDGKEITMCRAAMYRTKHAWQKHVLGGQKL